MWQHPEIKPSAREDSRTRWIKLCSVSFDTGAALTVSWALGFKCKDGISFDACVEGTNHKTGDEALACHQHPMQRRRNCWHIIRLLLANGGSTAEQHRLHVIYSTAGATIKQFRLDCPAFASTRIPLLCQSHALRRSRLSLRLASPSASSSWIELNLTIIKIISHALASLVCRNKHIQTG